MIWMESVETQYRCRRIETNGGEVRRTMEDNMTSTETETREDDNGGGVDAEHHGIGYTGQQG